MKKKPNYIPLDKCKWYELLIVGAVAGLGAVTIFLIWVYFYG